MGWLSRLSANLLEPPSLTILGVLPHFTAPIFLTHRTLHRFHTNTLSNSLGKSMKVVFEEKQSGPEINRSFFIARSFRK